LPAHPLDLWANACADVRPSHADQLAALAAEHDASTGGPGLYWVGKAILAASLSEDIRHVTKIRNILDRWRADAAYGSDLPRQPYERPKRSAAPDRPRRPAAAAAPARAATDYDALLAEIAADNPGMSL
jgi:hypothetical protein